MKNKLKFYYNKMKITNNKYMIYLVGLFVGFLNGLFASGAGQILVFYLIFIKKLDTHLMRAVSVAVLSTSSIISVLGYSSFVEYDIIKIIVLAIIAAITGYLGSKLMKIIPANILNLISGVLIVGLTIYKFLSGGGS